MPQAHRPWAKALLLAAGLLGAGGCGGQTEQDLALLLELERLAYVPQGQVRKGVFLRADFRAEAAESLLVDRFEVTHGDLKRAATGTLPGRDWTGADEAGAEADTWPASMGYDESTSYAQSRGMRLPTPGEWLYIASGNPGHRYPWGYNSQESVANTLDLGMERSLAVGTFEAGRGPFGTYDQLGNVWEWTTGWVPGIGDPIGVGAGVEVNAGGLEGQPYLSVMGGSYTSRQRPLFVEGGVADVPLSFFAKTLTPEHRALDVGVRCVAGAEAFLVRMAPDLPLDHDSQQRLAAVGERWFATGESDLIGLLERLVQQLGPGTGLDHILQGARP